MGKGRRGRRGEGDMKKEGKIPYCLPPCSEQTDHIYIMHDPIFSVSSQVILFINMYVSQSMYVLVVRLTSANRKNVAKVKKKRKSRSGRDTQASDYYIS